ncbi:MAG: hypothetical protein BGO76_05820 [Caedibacter sp. 38-128]|nr:hypothetical protein [Holosporales bacterium]OJX03563.1 MAG: hypothetical protein BGO76_05820 [Caedibacter sp. 38-128]
MSRQKIYTQKDNKRICYNAQVCHERDNLEKAPNKNFFLKKRKGTIYEKTKKKWDSFLEYLKPTITHRWKENIVQGLYLTFTSLRDPTLITFNFKKKVNCPIDFKRMSS